MPQMKRHEPAIGNRQQPPRAGMWEWPFRLRIHCAICGFNRRFQTEGSAGRGGAGPISDALAASPPP